MYNIYQKFIEKKTLFSYFCSLFWTLENMQRFGSFFSKKIFTNIIKDIINDTSNIESARHLIIKVIENIFYSKVENSLIIDEDKKRRIFQIKQMNEI